MKRQRKLKRVALEKFDREENTDRKKREAEIRELKQRKFAYDIANKFFRLRDEHYKKLKLREMETETKGDDEGVTKKTLSDGLDSQIKDMNLCRDNLYSERWCLSEVGLNFVKHLKEQGHRIGPDTAIDKNIQCIRNAQPFCKVHKE